QFLLPGMMTMAMMFGAETTMTTMANDSKKGITDRLRSMTISDASVSLGRVGADMDSSTVQIAILVIGGLLLGWRTTNSSLAGIIALARLVSLRFAALWVGSYVGLSVGRHEGASVLVQNLVWSVGFL